MREKNVVFRVDASLDIGTGHVMRCLTLADALQERGVRCRFVSRAHEGNLIGLVRQRGYDAMALPVSEGWLRSCESASPAHAAWVGADWFVDAQQTQALLSSDAPDWLIVDHYGLDARWEREVSGSCAAVMVVDDLADRQHECSILLDQNLGRRPGDYAELLPVPCTILTGPNFALLRPEFRALRSYSLRRRQMPKLKRILITMGGIDQSNATGEVLRVLQGCNLPADGEITVIMGANAPWQAEVRTIAAAMPWATDVLVNVGDMARRMADSDVAIGAAGGTSWERCCLGLPTLSVVLADNQQGGARALEAEGAALHIGEWEAIASELPVAIKMITNENRLRQMASAASNVTEGAGVELVLGKMGF